jgi:hypothetical protein
MHNMLHAVHLLSLLKREPAQLLLQYAQYAACCACSVQTTVQASIVPMMSVHYDHSALDQQKALCC